jgi:sarcosine oxidase subunit alpha
MVKRLKKVERGAPFTLEVDADSVQAFPGETLATVMLAAGKLVISRSSKTNSPRGLYCGMGVCNECLVTLEDGSRVRACQTLAVSAMRIKTG